MSDKITIELDAKDALVRHIENLQAVLTKRNARIEQLEEQLEGESPLVTQAHAKGYTAGWRACVDRFANITHQAARALDDVRKEALKIYYDETKGSLHDF